MASRRNHIVGLVLIASLAACATYSEPGPGTPHAELILASNLGADPFQDPADSQSTRFFAWADVACNEAHGLLARFEGRDGSQQTLRIPAGKPLYIRADWTHAARHGNQTETRYCANLVSFLPEAGQVYEISQAIGGSPGAIYPAGCVTTVRNMDGYRRAQSLREHAIEGKCK